MARTKNEDTVYDTTAPKSSEKTTEVRPKYDFTNLNSLAVVSIATAVTGFGAAAGVITGHVSLAQITKSGQAGRGLAIAGVAIGYTVIGLWILGTIGAIGLTIWGMKNGYPLGGYDDGMRGGFGFDRGGRGDHGYGHDGGMMIEPMPMPVPETGTTQVG